MLTTDRIYALLEERREELGLSQADVGARALGKNSSGALQSIRRGASPSIERLEAIANVLGLEVYVGPPRAERSTGFAEAALGNISPAIDGSPEALREGYLPIRFHEEASPGAGFAPLAFSRKWLREHGLAPDTTAIVRVPEAHGGCDLRPGDLTLLDTTQPARLDGRTFAYFNGLLDGVRFARLLQLPTGPIVSLSGEPEIMEQVEQRRGFRVLGAVTTRVTKEQ